MLVYCTESFPFTQLIIFEKDVEYVFSVSGTTIVFFFEGKFYQIPTETLKKHFSLVIF